MTSDGRLSRLSRDQQFGLILVVGVLVTVAGLVGSSAVDPTYDPLAFGVGVVMVAYAVVGLLADRVRALVGSE